MTMSHSVLFLYPIAEDLTKYEFLTWGELPELLRCASLPSVLDISLGSVHNGLCVVMRHLVQIAHCREPDQHFLDLLVSCWFTLTER